MINEFNKCKEPLNLWLYDTPRNFFSKECRSKERHSKENFFQGMPFPRNATTRNATPRKNISKECHSKEFLFLLYITKNCLANKLSFISPLYLYLFHDITGAQKRFLSHHLRNFLNFSSSAYFANKIEFVFNNDSDNLQLKC